MLVAGCGGGAANSADPSGSSASAHELLVATFTDHHPIRSGVISLALTIAPSGSSTITSPVEISFGGPFNSASSSKPPQSDFTLAVVGQGHRSSLQIISAGGKGYVTLSGQSYQMPASSFSQLQSGVGTLAGSSGSSTKSSSDTLGKLGIRPLDWLTNPRIVGGATVNGAATTHIRAGVDRPALIRDLSKLLARANSVAGTTSSLAQGLSVGEQRSIARALGSVRLDVWSGTHDGVIRKLTTSATIPVTGRARTLLGGMTDAVVTLDFEYSHLNEPQTITAPSSVKPYNVFRAKVATFFQELEGVSTGSANAGTGSTATIQSGTTTVLNANPKYTNCITAARGDVVKMQRCAKLLTAS